ncbi:MAG: M42 family peptidase [Candidatus Latescibacteria bacterium]|nr:M42 family peptidase [Candidatus Latescibacterota bacterium]
MLSTLERLIMAHSPSGAESEVDRIVEEAFRSRADEVYQDEAGNIVGVVKGEGRGPGVAVTGHKDEIGMIVKRVEADGRLRVRNVGGAHPWAMGEGPVDLIGEHGVVTGILSVGTKHVSSESSAFVVKQDKALTWDLVWIETKLSPEALAAQGVGIGTKAVVGRHRKRPIVIGDYVCGYALDCKAAVAIMLDVMDHLRVTKPARDTTFIASAEEEVGGVGATYRIGELDVDTAIALEVGPVATEYQTQNTGDPILLYQDAVGLYSEGINRRLESLARGLGFGIQRACVTSFGSDASIARKAGRVARAVCLCYPAENTHGYEICSLPGIENTAKLLLEYLKQG